MPWVISNGKTYINKNASNALTPTKDVTKAEWFEDQYQAEQFRKNMPKSLRNLNYVCTFLPPKEAEGAPTTAAVARETVHTTDNLQIDPAILELNTFVDNISSFQKFVETAHKQKAVLEEGIKRVEAEITDIEHAIEFSHCNVVGGYQWYKMLQEARQRRRTYKNAVMRIDILMATNPMPIAQSNLVNQIKGTGNLKYTPRALPHLFAKGGTPIG